MLFRGIGEWEKFRKDDVWSKYDMEVMDRYVRVIRDLWGLLCKYCDVVEDDGEVVCVGVNREGIEGGVCEIGRGLWVVLDKDIGGVVCEEVVVRWESDEIEKIGGEERFKMLEDRRIGKVSWLVLNWMLEKDVEKMIGKGECVRLLIPWVCGEDGVRPWSILSELFMKGNSIEEDWRKYEEKLERGKLIVERVSDGRWSGFNLGDIVLNLYDICDERSKDMEWRKEFVEKMRELGIRKKRDIVVGCFVNWFMWREEEVEEEIE